MGEEITRALIFAGLAWLTFAPLERLGATHREPRPERLVDTGFATVGVVVMQVGVSLAMAGVLMLLDALRPERPLFADVGSRGLRIAAEVVVGLLVFDLFGYAYHRLAHAVPWMWRFHAVHHSSTRMDGLASFRQHPVELVLVTVVQNTPLLLLGIPLGAHAFVLLALRLHTVFVHADLQLHTWFWRTLIAGPEVHHRHHDRDLPPRNYAAMFPWIDRLFRTYDARRATIFGTFPALPTTFTGLLLHPFRTSSHPRHGGRPAPHRD